MLIKASDYLVDGASSLARRAGMSDYLVGLTVVAFATSMPELVVNLLAIKDGIDGIALGNVVGSNTLNIFIVVGLPAMIVPMFFKNKKLLLFLKCLTIKHYGISEPSSQTASVLSRIRVLFVKVKKCLQSIKT